MKVVIAGWGRSGTTALFFRLKQAMPQGTVFLFEPREYPDGEIQPADNVLAKILILGKKIFSFETKDWLDNRLDYDRFSNFDKKILLVRDPRDRLISGLLYSIWNAARIQDEKRFREYAQALERKERDPGAVSVTELMVYRGKLSAPEETLNAWVERLKVQFGCCLRFHDQYPDYFLFRYEDMIGDRFDELEKYLGLTIRGKVAVEKNYARVARAKQTGDWRNWFLKEDVELFRPVFDEFMRRYGYQDDWVVNSPSVIRPEHASIFVKNLREERLRKLNLSSAQE